MIQWWWSTSDDPVVVMIQIPWLRRLEEEDYLEEDLEMKMTLIWRILEDDDDLKMKKTWRWRQIEDEDDEMIQSIQQRRPVLKIGLKEYLPS